VGSQVQILARAPKGGYTGSMKLFGINFGGGEAPAKTEQTSPATLNTAESTGPKLNAQGTLDMSPELQKAVSQPSSADAWGKVEIGNIHRAEAELAGADVTPVEGKEDGEKLTPVNELGIL
jgi:hypothetical protein